MRNSIGRSQVHLVTSILEKPVTAAQRVQLGFEQRHIHGAQHLVGHLPSGPAGRSGRPTAAVQRFEILDGSPQIAVIVGFRQQSGLSRQNGRSDSQLHSDSLLVEQLARQQGRPKHRMQLAGQTEQRAVARVDVKGNHRNLRPTDKPHHPPGPLAVAYVAESFAPGRYFARREDHEQSAPRQMPHRLAHAGDVPCGFRVERVHADEIALQRTDPRKQVIAHETRVGTPFRQPVDQHDAVESAGGMIRDHDGRSFGRNPVRLPRIDFGAHVHSVQQPFRIGTLISERVAVQPVDSVQSGQLHDGPGPPPGPQALPAEI